MSAQHGRVLEHMVSEGQTLAEATNRGTRPTRVPAELRWGSSRGSGHNYTVRDPWKRGRAPFKHRRLDFDREAR